MVIDGFPMNVTRFLNVSFLLDLITYQALVLEGIVNAPEEKPERPQIFESKLQKVICQKYECPQ